MTAGQQTQGVAMYGWPRRKPTASGTAPKPTTDNSKEKGR